LRGEWAENRQQQKQRQGRQQVLRFAKDDKLKGPATTTAMAGEERAFESCQDLKLLGYWRSGRRMKK
jgi:hypothetical protein